MSIKYSGTFAITAQPSISVTTPSGPFAVGDTVNIAWSTTGTVGYVKIQLYKSTSSTATITTSTSNDGSYSWTIQNSDLDGSSSFYKLKVFETDGSPVGYSGYFTINNFILKEPADSTSLAETVNSSTVIWKHVKDATDSIQFSTDSVNTSTRAYKIIKEPTDSSAFTESVSTDTRVYKLLKEPVDTSSISETVVPVPIRKPAPSDTPTLAESVSGLVDQWKKIKNPLDSTSFSENIIITYNRAKKPADSASVNESINWWLKSDINTSDSATLTELVTGPVTLWKHLKDPSDSVQFSSDSATYTITEWHHKTAIDSATLTEGVSSDTRIWKKNKYASDTALVTEEVESLKRLWKHLKDATDSAALTEVVNNDVVPWHRFVIDTAALTEVVSDEVVPWHRFVVDSSSVTESVETEINKWHHVINEVLSCTEDVTDVNGQAPIDSAFFIESVTTAVFRSAKIRQFSDTSTEVFGAVRKSGWFTTEDENGNSTVIRRLNVEYNSADPLDFKMYIDGDDSNHVLLKTLPAATGVETTNKSIRVGKRAKNFMLEIASTESTNSNVKIEDIEVEIDGEISTAKP